VHVFVHVYKLFALTVVHRSSLSLSWYMMYSIFPLKTYNNSIMPASLMTTKRTELEIFRATNDAIRGRRQRSPSTR
jgi:hypothetical protein